MASPQKENGYTSIANELLEAFCLVKMPEYERAIILHIWRKTYGFSKKEDWIANSQFVLATGINKSNISRGLASLKGKNVVICRDNRVSVNKDWESWKVIWRDNNSYLYRQQKLSPTQPQKKKAKNNNSGIFKKKLPHSKSMNTYDENKFSDEYGIIKTDEFGNTIEEVKPKKDIGYRLDAENLLKFYNSKYKIEVGDDIPYYPKGAYLKQVKPILEKYNVEKLKELLGAYFYRDDKITRGNKWSISCFLSWKMLTQLDD